MTHQPTRPRLAAVLAADVAGYTRLMEQDTDATVAAWQAARDGIIDPFIETHAGRLVKLTGDGFLAEFSSVQDAVRCALAMRDALVASPLAFRMGINLGDIVDDGRDIHGEGVNVAARLESLAEPGGICISGEVHAMVRNRVQYQFEDLGEHTVKHVTHAVRVYAIRGSSSAKLPATVASTTMANERPAEATRPSIAVLPFVNMSGDREQDYFADGMVEDIITALSRVRWLTVIARNSSFSYKGRAVDVKQIGQELGARYMLEGSVRRAANRLRITAQLIDAATGAHLWAERFDGEMEDIFELQDQVAASVVGTVAPRLEEAEIERAGRKPTASLDAYDYYLRGMAAFHEFTRTANEQALAHFLRAAELDPRFASAHGMASRCYGQRKGFGWLTDERKEGAEARRMAGRAAELGRDDSIALGGAGMALVLFGDLADGAALLDRALVLNPNLAWAWHTNGFAQALLGRGDLAIEHATRAIRLSPQDPQMFAMRTSVAFGHFFSGRDEEALSWAQAAFRERPNFTLAAGIAAASAALLGRRAEADKAMASLRQINPGLRLSNLRGWLSVQQPRDFDRWAGGLRQAGLPEK